MALPKRTSPIGREGVQTQAWTGISHGRAECRRSPAPSPLAAPHVAEQSQHSLNWQTRGNGRRGGASGGLHACGALGG